MASGNNPAGVNGCYFSLKNVLLIFYVPQKDFIGTWDYSMFFIPRSTLLNTGDWTITGVLNLTKLNRLAVGY